MNSQENSYDFPMDRSRRVQKLQAKQVARIEQATDISKKVLGYIRVSTEEQASKGHGLEAQERAVWSFAESQGFELIGVETDGGVSGAKKPSERAGFRRVLQLAKDRLYSILLVWKFDRLARNLFYSVTTVNDLKEKYGVVLRSVTEPIDTSNPMGEMIFTLFGRFRCRRAAGDHSADSGRQTREGEPGRILRWRGAVGIRTQSRRRPDGAGRRERRSAANLYDAEIWIVADVHCTQPERRGSP
jgi:site-specific DNA recombinase